MIPNEKKSGYDDKKSILIGIAASSVFFIVLLAKASI